MAEDKTRSARAMNDAQAETRAPSRAEISAAIDRFRQSGTWRPVAEVLQTLVPYAVVWLGMMMFARRGHPWLALAMSVLAGALLVRVFIIFHDCCHGSFFASRRANRVLGYVTGVLTLTPFDSWQRAHAEHHATAADLDRRGVGDMWTLTVNEYLAASWRRRLFYRIFRNPFIMLGVGPAFVFVVANRFAGRHATPRERFSVHFTNAAIGAALAGAYFTIGLPTFLLVQSPTLLVAAGAGVWLFYVQHPFEGVYWARHEAWDPLRAALEGSSYYKLPKVLQWVTGSIGLHHIHHVQPRIPSYNLQRCQDAVPVFQSVPPLTIRQSLRSLRMRLWDEAGQRMVYRVPTGARRSS
jgi:acyl-lipid omega-6 desaturase (Delta-12 desaturase)